MRAQILPEGNVGAKATFTPPPLTAIHPAPRVFDFFDLLQPTASS
jgi:hypothetical protein